MEEMNQPDLWDMFHSNPVCTFDQRMSKLKDHVATIALFDKVLAERSQWPDGDRGVKQIFLPRPPSAVIKTNWHTTAEGLLKKIRSREKPHVLLFLLLRIDGSLLL
jgi:hypothetical protein